jgi:SAM-dependent methyltransferase
MTTAAERFVAKLTCPACGAAGLSAHRGGLGCVQCGAAVPRRHGVPVLAPVDAASPATGEAALALAAGRFRRPWGYRLEKAVLEWVNPKQHLPITPHLTGREVLDVGCGPEPFGYDAAATSLHAGLDVSLPFLLRAAAANPTSHYVCGWAHRLPFADRSFDVVLLLQVLHHMPHPHRQVLQEACRVARERVIVYDHLQSDRGFKRWAKAGWWRLADRGLQYNTQAQWDAALTGFTVVERRITGRYLENIFEFALAVVPDAAGTTGR